MANENVELMIMDPHDTGNQEKGLYIITLNKDGEFVQIEPNALILASGSIYFSKNSIFTIDIFYHPTFRFFFGCLILFIFKCF